MAKKDGKKKKNWIVELLPFAIGGACGYFGAKYDWFPSLSLDSLLWIVAYFAAFILALLAQMAIHEAGHLVFGLLSGYEFCSYRIFSLMWYKRDGRIHFGRYSLAGTGGQCLLAPPDLADGKMPVILYNLGGSLLNLISAALFLLLRIPLADVPWVSGLLGMLALFGLMFALLNGIPLRAGGLDNDGMNALSLGKNPAATRALWVQLKINQQTTEGLRLKDMPEAWFALPDAADMNNPLVASTGVFHCNRLSDQHRFEEADAAIVRLLTVDSLPGIYRNLLACDRIFFELTGENRREIIESLYTKAQKRFMKSMSGFPSVIRTEYALAKRFEQDEAKAAKALSRFEKMARSYPYPSDIESERELLQLVS